VDRAALGSREDAFPPSAATRAELDLGLAKEARRVGLLRWLLLIEVLAGSWLLFREVEQLELIRAFRSGANIGLDRMRESDDGVSASAGRYFLAYLVSGITWLAWFSRAYANLRLVGSRVTRFTSRWAVAVWFIPIWFIFRPYQISREIWLRSANKNATRQLGSAHPALLTWWWAAHLLAGFGATLEPKLLRGDPSPDQIMLASVVGTLATLFVVVETILDFKVIARIHDWQQTFADPTVPA